MSDEFEHEPVRGLPGRLPSGEHILWQGAPEAMAFAKRALHVRGIAIYFGLLMVWRVISGLDQGQSLAETLWGASTLLPVAVAAIGLLMLYAWLVERTTVYTITNRRVVIRAGVAVPKAINLPFTIIGGVDLEADKSGHGSLALSLTGRDRIAYLHVWPHVRPWRLAKAQPMLRAVAQARDVGAILAGALEASGAGVSRVRQAPTPAAAPAAGVAEAI